MYLLDTKNSVVVIEKYVATQSFYKTWWYHGKSENIEFIMKKNFIMREFISIGIFKK